MLVLNHIERPIVNLDEGLLQKLVNFCHGLPLKLRLLGVELKGRQHPEGWQVLLGDLQARKKIDALQGDTASEHSIFMRSIEDLSVEVRTAFVDIALFFPRTLLLSRAQRWCKVMEPTVPSNCIQVLENKSLISLVLQGNYWDGSAREVVTVHDALRDFAEYYVMHQEG